LTGTVCYGHITGVTQDHARPFSAGWTGTGSITGSNDNETLTLSTGQNEESEIINIGTGQIDIIIDEYQSGSGDSPVIKYKNGNSEANCNADSWNTYSAPFNSLGYIKIRVEK
jgi:hypothetical protein